MEVNCMPVHFRVYYVNEGESLNFLNVKTICMVLIDPPARPAALSKKIQNVLSKSSKVYLRAERTIFPF